MHPSRVEGPATSQLEQRLLRMAAVLGLVPDPLAVAVEHLGRDLLARMRGEAVQRERARRRAVEQRVVDAVGRERRAARAGGRLVAHADPHVGVDGVGAGGRLGRVVEQARARVRLELVAGGRGDAHLEPGQGAERPPASGRRCCRRRRRRACGPPALRRPPAASAGRRAPGTGGARREHVHDGDRRVRGELRERRLEPVRSPIAATWRDRTSAVSRTDSPRVSCSSSGRRTMGWPPSSTIPASNEIRVRVEGFSKMSATVRPSSARERARRRLERERAVQERGRARRATARLR